MMIRHVVAAFLIVFCPLSYAGEMLWGVAGSDYQFSGSAFCNQSNWSDWEQKEGSWNKEGGVVAAPSHDAMQWNIRYRTYIDQMIRDMPEITTFRFSIEWAALEPQEGVINKDALAYYHDLIDYLVQKGITPIVTMHHFVHPLWFEQKGGFEKQENIEYFVKYCTFIFNQFSGRVSWWCTINEPGIFVLQGYIRGVFPPGKQNIVKAILVLRNLLEAHMRVYKTLKALPEGKVAHIGLVHQFLVFKPYHAWNLIEYLPMTLSKIITYSVVDFLKTGTFNLLPFASYQYTVPAQEPRTDFLGLNYYARVLITQSPPIIGPLKPTALPGEIMTDMPYPLTPDHFYETLMFLNNELHVPIIVTECGIADKDDSRRGTFFTGYLNALARAVDNGANILGFCYWSLMDNYEWDMGWEQCFGLYAIDRATESITLRPSAHMYRTFIAQWKDRITENKTNPAITLAS